MDYSTLNRLKDKLEQATSAFQVASISAEIEKEERRIREAEEREDVGLPVDMNKFCR